MYLIINIYEIRQFFNEPGDRLMYYISEMIYILNILKF